MKLTPPWGSGALCLCYLIVLLSAGSAIRAADQADGKAGLEALPTVKDFKLLDLKTEVHTPAAWRDSKGVVLFFLGTECPVSNSYAPEFSRLAKAYADQAVLFYGVHADPDVNAEMARKHAAEYHLRFSILLDPAQVLAGQTGATMVPEAVLLTADGRVLYRGRIDDRYAADGKRRERPKSSDLEQALKAVLAGKAPPVTTTKVFGCPLPPPAKASEK
jgi:thiol-disulfide isomerase/thioredoxin